MTAERTTATLSIGDRLRSLKAQPVNGARVPFAVAQGFVFGDGTRGSGERPATLTIYDKGKDKALLPFFGAHEIRDVLVNGGQPGWHIYGLPRTWKEAPRLDESRSFLLSWLAGYFAADGQVTADGSARLDSADRNALTLARGIAEICGVGVGPIRSTERIGTGSAPTPIFTITLAARDLPAWFFIIDEHRRRIDDRAPSRERDDRSWRVRSLEPTQRVEEVFCAVVPGVHAFALSDDLMTGNCILASKSALIRAAQLRPGLAAEYVRIETEIGHTFKKDLSMADIVAAAAREPAPVTIDSWVA